MNKVILVGNLVKNVDLRFIQGTGTAMAQFTIAVAKRLNKEKKAELEAKGKQTSDFIRCKSFGKTAETISQHFSKGNKILVEGSIDTGSYKKDDGTTVYTTDVLVNNFEFVESFKKETKDDDFTFDNNVVGINDDEDLDDIPF